MQQLASLVAVLALIVCAHCLEFQRIVTFQKNGAVKAYPRSIEVDTRRQIVYWTDINLKKIQCTTYNGTDLQDVVVLTKAPVGLALDQKRGALFFSTMWDEWGPAKIYKKDLNTNDDPVEVLSLPEFCYADELAVDTVNRRLYWTDPATVAQNEQAMVQSAKYDGTDVKDVVRLPERPRGIAIDSASKKLFWTDSETDKVASANFDGSSQAEFASHQDLTNPRGITVHPETGVVYWTDIDAGAIVKQGRGEEDEIEEVLIGLGAPYSVAIDEKQEYIFFTDPGSFPPSIGRLELVDRTEVEGTDGNGEGSSSSASQSHFVGAVIVAALTPLLFL